MYKEINTKPEFINKWFNENRTAINDFEDWAGFDVFKLDKHLFIQNEPILNDVNNAFEIVNMAILKMDPHKFYKPHTDNFKKCKLNMLLTTQHMSHCLFIDDDSNIVEVPYEENTLYIFDTTKIHMIINFEKPRYLFSVSFNNDVTYEEVVNYYG